MENKEPRQRIILYTEREMCEILGIAPVTLWRERKAGRISYRRIGGKLRYTSEDLAEYLERCKVAKND